MDQQPVEIVWPSARHARFEVSQGEHRIELAVGESSTSYTLKVNGLSNFLLPLRGECFVWAIAIPAQGVQQLAKRYPADGPPIELPEDATLGVESAPVPPSKHGLSLFEPVQCERLSATDEELLQSL